MTQIQNEGGASAPPDVIQFPNRNRGRVRKSRSLLAMGRCSVTLMEREGHVIPSNVADIQLKRREPDIDDGRLALRLALAVYAKLGAGEKMEIQDAARMYARQMTASEAMSAARSIVY